MATSIISKQACRAILLRPRARSRALPPSTMVRPRSAPSSSRTFASRQGGGEEVPPPPTTTTTTITTRPFRILGMQQIAIGSLDKSSLSNLWVDILGVPRIGNYRNERENVDEDVLLLGKIGSPHAVELDVMMPIDPTKSPRVHVPPLNHIGLWVDDLHAAVKWMEGRGVRFTPGGIRKGASGHDVTFIHPKGNEESPIGGGDVLIELVQAPEEVIEALT